MAAYTTIDNPELYFQTKIYSGDGNDDRNIVFDVTDTSLQPNMLWSARRDSADNLSKYDSVRGDGKELRTAESGAEYDRSDNIQALNSNGFQVGTDGQVNASGGTYVSWAWKESATAGFDILTFTGNASGNQTVSHNLSAVPKWWNIKRLDQASNWCTYHVGLGGADHNVFLNTTNAIQTDTGIWNDTLPTSSVFSVGNNIDSNGSGASHVWYGWSEIQGYSKFGTYEGNNNASGPYIYLGFKPAWFMTKKSNGSKDWNIYDNKRSDSGGGNPNDQYLEANNAAAEQSGQDVDFLSTGVKIRSTSSEVNGDDNNFIYMAFAESPLVNSNGVPNNAE